MGLPAQLRVLVLARCINRLGGFSMAFLGVLLLREVHATAAETALALTCFGAATIPSRVIGGHLADSWGHRPTMLLGLAGCAGAQLLIAASPTYATALLGATLLGLAYEILEPPTQALVSDLVPEESRTSAYSALNASLAVAGVLAGLLAAAVSGAGLRWLFVLDAATCLACAALVAHAIPARVEAESPAESPAGPPEGRGTVVRAPAGGTARWRGALGDSRLRPVVAFGAVVATATMIVVLGLPLLVEQRGLPPSVTGWVLAAGAAASVPGAWFGTALRRRSGEQVVLVVGEAAAAVGLAAIAVAPGPVLLAVGLVVFDVGGLLLVATTMARGGTLAPEGSRGTYLAVLGLTWGLATSVAPGILTTLGTAYGPGAPFGAAAVALLATAAAGAVRRVASACAPRSRPQRPRLRRRISLGGRPPA